MKPIFSLKVIILLFVDNLSFMNRKFITYIYLIAMILKFKISNTAEGLKCKIVKK